MVWKADVLRFYLYIGITSLYLYHSAGFPFFQDGIFSKKLRLSSCKREKLPFRGKIRLTPAMRCGMLNLLGGLGEGRPFSAG